MKVQQMPMKGLFDRLMKTLGPAWGIFSNGNALSEKHRIGVPVFLA